MKKLLFLLLLFPMFAIAQNSASYTFEETDVPSDWSAKQGTLSLTAEHYKEGAKSLCWNTTGESVLEVSVPSMATIGRATYMQLRSQEETGDELKVEFLDGSDKVRRTARVKINFRGWAEFNRAYNEYSNSLTALTLTKVRFTLLPSDITASRRLYFDAVDFSYVNPQPLNRRFTAMWVLDVEQLPAKDSRLLLQFANPIDINVTPPTQEELAGLKLLRTRLMRQVGQPVAVGVARSVANKYNIVRNADGSVTGNVIDCTSGAMTSNILKTLFDAMQTLSNCLKSESDSLLFYNLVDHVIDQGVTQCANYEVASNNYNDARGIPASIFNVASKLIGDRRDEMLKLGRWLSEYGTVYYPENKYLSEFNSDLLYNYLTHMYDYALLQADDAVAVRELKAMKRYLNRHCEIVPGTSDMLKIDGTGFHHATHYNNYMYALKSWIDYVYILRGTPFNITADHYPRLRQAALAMYSMATKNIGASSKHYFPNSLCGRNPYIRGGINVQIPLTSLENLVSVGGEILGKSLDEELAAAYNYYTKSRKFDVADVDFDGYYQYNYSPIGVCRKDDWVAVMRAPTSYFWGAEIYSGQNRFGRYQSHGTLEVVYAGDYARSGIPTANSSGGWDWNVVPGTTTVHYTKWTDMNPGKTTTTTQRFDQKASGTNFSGALAFGKNGVFATDFVQGDDWGSQVLVPTGLKFKKSVFTFDSIFVALGTNISATNTKFTDLITATNLFQEVKSEHFEELVMNGNPMADGTDMSNGIDKNYCIVTPLGTGYYVPKASNAGNSLVMKFGPQKSPVETGMDIVNPFNSLTVAKAYINHGKNPSSAQYHFVMVPATTPKAMADLADKIGDDGGTLYTVQSQTDKVHAVTYNPSQTTGYAFFGAVPNLTFGDIISTTTEHLLMVTRESSTNRLRLAITNPNLRPKSDSRFGFLSQPTQTIITVRGEWKSLKQTDGIQSVMISGGNTQISVTLSEGMPEYLTLGTLDDTAVSEANEDTFVTWTQLGDELKLWFAPANEVKVLKLFRPDGTLAYTRQTNDDHYTFQLGGLTRGIYLLQVKAGANKKVIRFIV